MDQSLTRGGLAGAIATIPMTAVMLTAEKTGLMGKIPPKHITLDLLRFAGVRHTSHRERNTATMGLHFTYGMSTGALYGWLARRLRLPVPGIVQGIGYALAVWAASYMGWIPALGIMRPEQRQGKGWILSNVTAHVVYGAVLGAIAGKGRRRLQARTRRDADINT